METLRLQKYFNNGNETWKITARGNIFQFPSKSISSRKACYSKSSLNFPENSRV